MFEDDTWSYECPQCGSECIDVKYAYTVTENLLTRLECTCGEAPEGIAAERYYHVLTEYEDWGILDDEHRVDWTDRNMKMDGPEEEEDSYEVACYDCVENASEYDWADATESTDDDDPEDDLSDDGEWYVLCGGCHREIEFGWSHPDRAGRIWPAECSDFNPWKSWPEPRYRESWAAKGWLRPGT